MSTLKLPRRDDVLRLIGERGPVSVPRLAELFQTDPKRLSASVANWYRDASHGWEHVHRELRERGIGYMYVLDATITKRQPEQRQPRAARTGKRETALAVPEPQPAESAPVDKLAALVLWDTHDDVILLDANGDIIRGRRLQ